MNKFFVPTNGYESWKALLAEPKKHWKSGYSAKSLAHCWEEAGAFPTSIQKIFSQSANKKVRELKFLLGFPEYKVFLPPEGGRPSQNDIFVLAKSGEELFVIMVEGKVAESFADTVEKMGPKINRERFAYLCKVLELNPDTIGHIRYQLLHRTVSALLEAERFNAKNAIMLVHSFSRTYDHFQDYAAFTELFGFKAEKDTVMGPVRRKNVDLFFGWSLGDAEFLTR